MVAGIPIYFFFVLLLLFLKWGGGGSYEKRVTRCPFCVVTYVRVPPAGMCIHSAMNLSSKDQYIVVFRISFIFPNIAKLDSVYNMSVCAPLNGASGQWQNNMKYLKHNDGTSQTKQNKHAELLHESFLRVHMKQTYQQIQKPNSRPSITLLHNRHDWQNRTLLAYRCFISFAVL